MRDELKRMNKGFMRKDGKFFLPITHESLVVDNDGTSLAEKYVNKAMLEGYATISYVDEAILKAQIGGEVDLSGYATIEQLAEKADKSEIPFVDVNKSYVDEQIAGHTHEEYATEDFVKEEIEKIDLSTSHVHLNKAILDTISLEKINEWDSKSDFSGSFKDLTDVPEFPDVTDMATQDFVIARVDEVRKEIPKVDVTKAYVDTELYKKADKGHKHSIANIIDMPEIPSIEGLASEQFVLDEIAKVQVGEGADLSEYTKKEYVDAQDKALKEEFRKSLKHEVDLIHEEMVEEVGLINKEMEEEIEEVNRVITEQVEKINSEHTEHVVTLYGKAKDLRVRMEALEAIDHEAFLTEHQDISHLATKEEIPSIEGLATEAYVDEKIAGIVIPEIPEVEKYDDSEVKARLDKLEKVKYEIKNLPEGALVDFREKEIRVMCPEGTEFKQQQVGETGNPNMYYMSLISQAPEGAVKLIESDGQKTETIELNGKTSKTIWLALANLSGGKWNYFGKTSTNKKYIGWTYTLKWLDENDNVIESDSFRVNLANESCYHAFESSCVGALTGRVEALEAKEMPEIPSLEGLATEAFVEEKIAAIEFPECDCEQYDDSELKGRVEALEAVDHDAFLTEHQDISHLAVAEEVDAALETKADKSDIPSINGLASEEFVQQEIAKIEIPECEKYDDTDLQTRVSALEALEHILKPNFTYKINMIAPDKEAFVQSEGDYPNITLTFNIPMGTVSTEEPEIPEESGTPRMWIGYINYDETGKAGINDPDQISENMSQDTVMLAKSVGTLVEMDPQELDKYPIAFKNENGGYICCIYPKANNYTFYYQSSVSGDYIPFENLDDGVYQFKQIGTQLVNKINGVTYCQTGAFTEGDGVTRYFAVKEN